MKRHIEANKEKISLKIIILLAFLLFTILVSTNYKGGNDSTEYASVAKFFAGEYKADIRSSHSLIFGFIHSPLLRLFDSLAVMKITSYVFLILIALSLYYITSRDRRVLLLFLLSPIVWYMGPWINPIQLSALLFLWGFYFFTRFEEKERKIYLVYSGALIGLSAIIWNTMLFIAAIFFICFFYKHSVKNSIIFVAGFLIGMMPLFLFDFYYYHFPFYSFTKFLFGVAASSLYGGVYNNGEIVQNSLVYYVSFLLMLPVFAYLWFSRRAMKESGREIAFITLSLLFFLTNPQIRYIISIWPIIILILNRNLNRKQFAIQASVFAIISLIVIVPYAIQIKYSTNSSEFSSLLSNAANLKISSFDSNEFLEADLLSLEKEYPNQSFIVGNRVDDYALFALAYSGENVQEFVSVQDYELYLSNRTELFQKKLNFVPYRIQDRRQIWIAGGMDRSLGDETDYSALKYAISEGEPIKLANFTFVKNYGSVYLSKKSA